MLETVTFDEIWSALMQDSKFASRPETVRKAKKPYIEAIPEVLKEILPKPVTLQNLMQARLDYVQYCVDNGFVAAVVVATSREDPYFSVVSTLSIALSFEMWLAQSITDDMAAFFDRFDVTEEVVMRGELVGLRPDVLEQYEAGKLTIADVLATQPTAIISFN